MEFLQKTFYLGMSFSTRYFIQFRTVPLLILVTTTVGGVHKVISKKENIDVFITVAGVSFLREQ